MKNMSNITRFLTFWLTAGMVYGMFVTGIAFANLEDFNTKPDSALLLPQAVTVSLPQASGAPASSVTIPINATDLTGLGAQSYDFTLIFDQNVLQIGNPAFDTAGTLSSNMTITPNTGTPGHLVISAFGTSAISGSGTLLNLKFNVVGAAGATTPLTLQSFVFNEGTPTTSIVNGNFTVTGGTSCPTVSSINPTSGSVGASVTINGNNFNGVTAVKFSNNVAASFTINSNTQIMATAPAAGVTGPITLSKTGCADVQTGTFTYTGCAATVPVSIPTNLGSASGSTLIVPITVGSSLTGLGVTSYDFVLTFNAGVLSPASPAFDTAGTLSSGFTITPNTGVSGQITVSAFGTTALSGSGTLLNLRFTLAAGLPSGTCSNLMWTSFKFNEGNPCATTANGQACVTGRSPLFDFDGDGKADVAVFRPSTGQWFIKNSSNGSQTTVPWGTNGDVTAAADYDGDGKTDIAVFRPSNGTWYVINSSNGSSSVIGWGTVGDKPVPADYDADGKADVAVFRPSNGTWYIRSSINGSLILVGWGASTDVPISGRP